MMETIGKFTHNTHDMKKLYRIIIDVQFGDLLETCNELYDGAENKDTIYSNHDGDAVIDYLQDWDGYGFVDEDLQEEEPRWARNNTDYVHHKDGYTLIYNASLGGVYMLYREANKEEYEYYYEKKTYNS